MRQILFRCKGLSIEGDSGARISDIDVEIRTGETVYLLGEKDSGRNLFFECLRGTVLAKRGILTCVDRDQTAFLSEKTRMSILTDTDCIMSVMDYIYLFQKKEFSFWWRRKAFEKQVDGLLGELGLLFDHNKKIVGLSAAEMLSVDLARCLFTDSRLFLMEESFLGMSEKERRDITRTMEQIKRDRGVSFVINCDSISFDTSFTGQCIVFGRNHSIVRKYRNHFSEMLANYERSITQRTDRDAADTADSPTVLSIEYHSMEDRTTDEDKRRIELKAGRILYLHEASAAKRAMLAELFSGKRKREDVRLRYMEREMEKGWEFQKETYRIVVIRNIGVEGLYENMSTSDNLLLPSLRKICSPKIAMPGKTVREAAMKEWTNGAQVPGRVNELSGLAQLSLQMESWMMFRPKAMILVDPFWGIDDESRSLLVRYLLRFRKQGCGILVISADSHREAEYIGGRWFDAHTTGV